MRSGHLRSGAAAVLSLAPATASGQVVAWQLDGQPGGSLGHALVALGDLDGDGVAELGVGAPHHVDAAGIATGRALIVSGATGALLRTHDGASSGDLFGWSIAALNDWDQDGWPDYAVGAIGVDVPANAAGAISIFSGATGVLHSTISGSAALDQLGDRMTGIDDADGDGIGDLLVGVSQKAQARVYAATGQLHFTHQGAAGELLGKTVARIGDVDHDGRDDYAVAEPFWSSGFTGFRRGRVHVFSATTQTSLGTVKGFSAGDEFGFAIAPLGDVNQDSWNDFAISSVVAGGGFGQQFRGQVQVVSGSTLAPLYQLDGVQQNDQFGTALCRVADLDLDGIDDFAATLLFGGTNDIGSLELRSGVDGHVLHVIEGTDTPTEQSADFGETLVGGDWNGDGAGDVALGDSLFRLLDPITGGWNSSGRVEMRFGAPAYAEAYGSGWPGALGVPSLDALGPPAFGTKLDVAIGNSAGIPTTGLLLVGTSTASIPWKDGTLLVNADLASAYLPIPKLGTFVSEDIPNDPALAFVDLYVQVVEVDPAASRKLSFTPGLRLRLGYDMP